MDVEVTTTITHGTPWMNDGNIIVQATSGTNHIVYKVHKSVLSVNCESFREMFGEDGGATLDTASEKYEGSPVMLLPDAAEDVDDFLKALYNPTRVSTLLEKALFLSPEYRIPHAVAGVLSLSHKYGAENLAAACRSVLRKVWPDDLDGWDAREADVDLLQQEVNQYHDPDNPDTLVMPDPALTIRLAVDFEIRDPLRAAFYSLACFCDVYNPATDPEANVEKPILKRREEIALVKVAIAIRSRVEQAIAQPHALVKWSVMSDGVDSCKRVKPDDPVQPDDGHGLRACKPKLLEWWAGHCRKTRPQQRNPLQWLKNAQHAVDTVEDQHACVGCRRWTKRSLESWRRKIWGDLPNHFNFV